MKTKMSLIEQALQIMIQAHQGQTRKTDSTPFIVHPLMVALTLSKYDFDDNTVAAALVHDVLEDTVYPAKQLKKNLGNKVFKLVQTVSENKDLPWEERKIKYIKQVRRGAIAAKAISLADKIHNLASMIEAYKKIGPKVWQKFNRGREQQIWFHESMLKMLKTSWRHPLIKEYSKLVAKMKKLK